MTPADLGSAPALVDTDVFSHVVWQHGPFSFYEPFLLDRLWVLSFATIAELRYGAERAGWGERRKHELERRIRLCVVVPGTDIVAMRWAALSLRFRDQIGVNDLWIAATALSQDPVLPIISHDRAFERIGAEFGITVVRLDES